MIEIDLDDEIAYAEEYAMNHPIYENGKVVGFIYPNGSIRWVDDDEHN